MKAIILSLVLVFVLSCKDEVVENVAITPITVSKGSSGSNAWTRKSKIFIKDAPAWNVFLLEYFRNNPIPEIYSSNSIDFSKYQIIGVFDPTSTSYPSQIDIVSITQTSENIKVKVQNFESGMAQMPSQPFHIVKIPHCTKPIVFYYTDSRPPAGK